MEVNGIIAEYNPFHNGHLYQIEEIKKQNQRAFIMVILSGYFCQRGEPAIVSPRARAEMALKQGADVVLQLPTYASLGSAEIFASTASRLLSATGVCQNLVFGSELDQLSDLQEIAKVLVDNETAMWEFMQDELKKGISYPKARQNFVEQFIGSEKADLLNAPNQILAIEYLKAIYQYKLKLKPRLIQRVGSSYRNSEIGSEAQASAMAIREFIRKHQYSENLLYDSTKTISDFMPISALAILLEQMQKESYLLPDSLASFYYASLENAENPGTRYMDESLFNRMKQEIRFSSSRYPSLKDFVLNCSSKQYPQTRVQRAILNLALNINEQEFTPAYLHVIGFTKNGRYLLKKMQQHAQLPVVMNFSEISSILDKENQWQEQLELRASRLWLNTAKQPINELFDSPLIMR